MKSQIIFGNLGTNDRVDTRLYDPSTNNYLHSNITSNYVVGRDGPRTNTGIEVWFSDLGVKFNQSQQSVYGIAIRGGANWNVIEDNCLLNNNQALWIENLQNNQERGNQTSGCNYF